MSSKDPFDPPVIDPGYLKEDEDVRTMVAAIKRARSLVNETEAFKSFQTEELPDLLLGKIASTEEEYEELLKKAMISLMDPVRFIESTLISFNCFTDLVCL